MDIEIVLTHAELYSRDDLDAEAVARLESFRLPLGRVVIRYGQSPEARPGGGPNDLRRCQRPVGIT
jgi:hypothetical protein